VQYVFLIRCRVGCKKYVSRLRLVTYFLQQALERIKKHVLHGQETVSIFLGDVTDREFVLAIASRSRCHDYLNCLLHQYCCRNAAINVVVCRAVSQQVAAADGHQRCHPTSG